MRLKIFFEGGLNGEEVVNFWMGGWGGGGGEGGGWECRVFRDRNYKFYFMNLI